MNIEGNVKRIIVSTGFIKNELFCIEDAPEFNKREHQKFRSDIYRLVKNCDKMFSIPKKMRDEIDDLILNYQEIFIEIMEADEEKLKKIIDILENKS